jgi:hypothetical protein
MVDQLSTAKSVGQAQKVTPGNPGVWLESQVNGYGRTAPN